MPYRVKQVNITLIETKKVNNLRWWVTKYLIKLTAWIGSYEINPEILVEYEDKKWKQDL